MSRHTEPSLRDLEQIRERLRSLADPVRAEHSRRFFKTGPGEYGEGDRFLGIPVPVLRKVARDAAGLPIPETAALLRSPHHEERLLALLLLVRAYERGDAARRDEIFRLYLEHTAWVNNWDLVDTSAPHIVGRHLENGDRTLLRRLASSESVWERRIAILATLHFIRQGEFATTFEIGEVLLEDGHDLIHKAVGWMLREVGERDEAAEERFLRARYRRMPRTMLRYAIERFPPEKRQRYLRGEIEPQTE